MTIGRECSSPPGFRCCRVARVRCRDHLLSMAIRTSSTEATAAVEAMADRLGADRTKKTGLHSRYHRGVGFARAAHATAWLDTPSGRRPVGRRPGRPLSLRHCRRGEALPPATADIVTAYASEQVPMLERYIRLSPERPVSCLSAWMSTSFGLVSSPRSGMSWRWGPMTARTIRPSCEPSRTIGTA